MEGKPLGSISMDLDNLWSYLKIHGDCGWETFPSFFDLIIPDVLDILNQLGLKITFFIVGQDALLDKNRDSLRALTEQGHELANHSFHHEPSCFMLSWWIYPPIWIGAQTSRRGNRFTHA